MKFVALFEPMITDDIATKFEFDVYANSSAIKEYQTASNSHKRVKIDILANTKLQLTGYVIPLYSSLSIAVQFKLDDENTVTVVFLKIGIIAFLHILGFVLFLDKTLLDICSFI